MDDLGINAGESIGTEDKFGKLEAQIKGTSHNVRRARTW